MYILRYTEHFSKRYQKMVQRNRVLEEKLKGALEQLVINPFYPSLKTHKAETKRFEIRYSSWVTGDLRIIWDFDPDNRIRIFLLDLGGHSGKEGSMLR